MATSYDTGATTNVVGHAARTPVVAGKFVPVSETSLVRTRSGVGWSGKLQPNETKSVKATGVSAVPAEGVRAVMLHISTSNSASPDFDTNGNVWAWPAGTARPRHAIVANAPAGSVADNTAIVRVGKAGEISFRNGPNGTAVDITADVEGYVGSNSAPAAGAAFAPLTPRRIIDTSDGTGGRSRPLRSKAAWTARVLGKGGLPTSGVSAVALNVGARATGTNCWVQVRPAGAAPNSTGYPRVDTYAEYTAQSLAVVQPDARGDVSFTTNCSFTDIYVDVEGYYLTRASGTSGEVYIPISYPRRIIDTRSDLGINGKMTARRMVKGSEAVAVTGVAGVPSDADAVALRVATFNANSHGYNTVWADGTAQSTSISTTDADPKVVKSSLIYVQPGPTGRIDVAGSSSDRDEANDLYVDIEGYFVRFAPPAATAFTTPQYFPAVAGDTYFNTVGPDGDIIATSDDSVGADNACEKRGGDIVILRARGTDPAHLNVRTVNCMTTYGPIGGGRSPDGCSWKSAGITRVGRTIYLAVARQLRHCSYGKEANGLQPSFNASIVRSVNGGHTWTNAWGTTGPNGAAPPYDKKRRNYKAMFTGQSFSAPFFIQYGPGNTQTVDHADKYLYAVSTDGYAYNGNYLRLARVPLNRVMDGRAWQFYHGAVGGAGRYWTGSAAGATAVLRAKHGLSQPAIQYVPALRRYVLITFSYLHGSRDFPNPRETPYTKIRFYSSPKPWGPWTQVFDHDARRDLWCAASPCQLTRQPGSRRLTIGHPEHWLGLYDPVLVQKFVFTCPLTQQALFTSGDFKNSARYPGERLYRLHAIPFDMTMVLRP